MAELDYAFLADYARVDPTGSLTSVGASFTHVQVHALPVTRVLAVAGRIRTRVGANPVGLSVAVTTPGGEIQLTFDSRLTVGPAARPYGDDKIGLLFANVLLVPLPRDGLYTVAVSIDGSLPGDLKFDVEVIQP